MPNWPVHARIDGPIVMIGFGSIGKGTLPLIERHFNYDKTRFVVIDPEDKDRKLLDERGIRFIQQAVTKDNYRDLLTPLLTDGGGQGFCVNLSVDTSSLDIMELCREIGALYIDTVVEPWPGFYFDKQARSGGALQLRAARDGACRAPQARRAARRRSPAAAPIPAWCPGSSSRRCSTSPTDIGLKVKEPKTREDWARLAQSAGVKGIHIAERDTQRAKQPKPLDVFVNTWSVEGFSRRACSRPSSAGARTRTGCRRTPASTRPAAARRSICCSRAPIRACAPGRRRRRRNTASWSPTTSRSRSPTTSRCARAARSSTGRPATTPITRATTRCCRCTRCSAARASAQQDLHILDEHEIVDGIDELGVLLYGHEKNAYWYGSQLSIEETRELAPYQNATGLQVTSAVLAGMVWALENPKAGIVEADEMDFRRCLEVQMPYLGPVIGAYTDWTPLTGRPRPVPGGHRRARSLAVQERAGALNRERRLHEVTTGGRRGRPLRFARSISPPLFLLVRLLAGLRRRLFRRRALPWWRRCGTTCCAAAVVAASVSVAAAEAARVAAPVSVAVAAVAERGGGCTCRSCGGGGGGGGDACGGIGRTMFGCCGGGPPAGPPRSGCSSRRSSLWTGAVVAGAVVTGGTPGGGGGGDGGEVTAGVCC